MFLEPLTVYREKHTVSHHFRRSHLKVNNVSKSAGTRKVEHHFKKCSDAVDRKLSKISPCLSKLQLVKVGTFFLRHSVLHLQIAWSCSRVGTGSTVLSGCVRPPCRQTTLISINIISSLQLLAT